MPWHWLGAVRYIARVTVTSVVLMYPIVVYTHEFFKGSVFKVNGRSMHPFLNPYPNKCDDWVYVEDIKQCEIYRGDVVTFIPPKDPSSHFIKRVVGLEGDTVVKQDGSSTTLLTVPLGHYWVEGDNKGLSIDSQHFGPVSKGRLQGKAFYIIWPPWRWQKIFQEFPSDCKPVSPSAT